MSRIGAMHTRPALDVIAQREAEGRSLRAWRDGQRLTRREVAWAIDVNPKTLERWEQGLMPIPDERREQLRALGWQWTEAA